jgi:hypothetical protein
MAVTQIADVIVPAVFQNYITENSLVSTALFQSGVAVQNGEMAAQLLAGAQSFTVPCWNDLIDTEANISSDDYTVNSVPLKLSTTKQVVRKSFLNQSWSEMNLASMFVLSNHAHSSTFSARSGPTCFRAPPKEESANVFASRTQAAYEPGSSQLSRSGPPSQDRYPNTVRQLGPIRTARFALDQSRDGATHRVRESALSGLRPEAD